MNSHHSHRRRALLLLLLAALGFAGPYYWTSTSRLKRPGGGSWSLPNSGSPYYQRVCQIHAIGRYVEEAQAGLDGGRRYVQSYFSLPAPEFTRHYFGDDPKTIERATSRESYAAIVESLRNDAQERIVTASKEHNLLVLAGPGAGKTRVVVHRAPIC